MGKTKGQEALFKKRRAAKKREDAMAAKPETEKAGPLALEYLRQWTTREEGGWKFNKTRQTYLLKFWPDRARVPNDEFKQLLEYMLSLPGGGAQRTIDQARAVAEEAERLDREEGEVQAAREADVARDGEGGEGEGENEDGDESKADAEASAERRALLKIKRARALKVMQTLLAVSDSAATS